jgi:hypothetical protein
LVTARLTFIFKMTEDSQIGEEDLSPVFMSPYLLFVGAVTGAVVLWLTYPLNYEITASTLIVRSGFMPKEILLSSIEEVCPTKNPLSAPAWSFDRLYVSYRDGAKKSAALISPEDKVAFMRELAERVIGLEVRGDCVVRAA